MHEYTVEVCARGTLLTFEGVTYTGSKALAICENVDNSNNSIIFMLRVGLLKLKNHKMERGKRI
jgi:hypothetical protein